MAGRSLFVFRKSSGSRENDCAKSEGVVMRRVREAFHRLAQHPAYVIYLHPWFLAVLPMWLIPTGWVHSPAANSLVDFVSSAVPMVQRVNPSELAADRVRLTLSVLWATGPIWAATAAVLYLHACRAGTMRPLPGREGTVVLGAFVFAAMLLILAAVNPRGTRFAASANFIFGNPLGLVLLGWFLLVSAFAGFGLVIAYFLQPRRKHG